MKELLDIVCNIEELKNKELFKNVKYYIIGKTHDQVRKLLAEGGAKESTYLTELVTLAIADDPTNSEVDEAADVFDIPVVTSRYVLLSAKCGILLPKNGFQPGFTQIFSNVCVCSSQLTSKDNEALWAMITFNGGKFSATLDQTCSHLIASKASGVKYNSALKLGANVLKIVTPDWVYDSIKCKARQEENKYHPRLLSVPVSVVPTSFDSKLTQQCSTSSAEDSPLEGLLLPENVALQLECLLDDVVAGGSIDLPDVNPITPSQKKVLVNSSPNVSTSSIIENVKVNPTTLTVKTNPEAESAPLQMKSSQWMTQQVQGVFGQQQQSLSPASNASPTFITPPNSNRETVSNWTNALEMPMKDVQISAGKVQQVVRVAVPPQYIVRQQQPQTQQQPSQMQPSQMSWQQQQQSTIRSPGPQPQNQQQMMMMRPQWHQGQIINPQQQQQSPRTLQLSPQQRAQVLAMQQHQATQQIQQPSPRPMPPSWQRQGISPRDTAPQFIGQPQAQMTTLVRPVMVQRTGVSGPGGQPQYWYQRGQHPQQVQGRVAWQQHPPQREMINVQLQQHQPQQQMQHSQQQMQQTQQQLQPNQQQMQSIQQQQGQPTQQQQQMQPTQQQQTQQQIQQTQQQQMQQTQQQQQMQQSQQQQMQQTQQQQQQMQQTQQQQHQMQQTQQQQQQMQQTQQQQQQMQQTQQHQQMQHSQQQQMQQQSQQPLQQTSQQPQQQIQQPQMQQQLQQSSQQPQQQMQQQLQQSSQQPQQQMQQQLQQPQQSQQQIQQSQQSQQQMQQQLQSQQMLQQQQLQLQQQQQQHMHPHQMPQRPASDRIISHQALREGVHISPQRFALQHQQPIKEGLQQERHQIPIMQSQQQFNREQTPGQMIIHREINQDPLHPTQIKDSILRQQSPNIIQPGQVHQTVKLVQNIPPGGPQPLQIVQQQSSSIQQSQQSLIIQQQQQQQRESHPLAQPMPQLKIRDGALTGVPVSAAGSHVTTTGNWPPPSPQVKQMLCQQQQLQQQAQRQIHPQGLAQHFQILQQQQQAQMRASVSQIRAPMIQQQMQQRPLSHVQGQQLQGQPQLQRGIVSQRISVTGFGNVNRYALDPPANNQNQVHAAPAAGVASAVPNLENTLSQTHPIQTPINPVQQPSQTPSPRDSLHQVVQQGQEQIQQQLQNLANQSQQLTPKTKSALTNMLNNRSQSRVPDNEMVAQPAVARFPNPVLQQHQQMAQPLREPGPVDHQRTLRNITNSGNATVLVRAAGGPKQATRFGPPAQVTVTQPTVPRVQFFAHDPALKIPAELCLLGCVFCIIDYERIIDASTLQVWSKVIEQYGGEIDNDYSPKCTHILCDNQRNSIVQQAMREGKRCVTAAWLNDVIKEKRMIPPWSALHFPTPFSEDKPCKKHVISVSNFEGEERQRLKTIILQTGAKYTGYFSRSNTLLVCRKADGIKYKSAKEWKIPCVNVDWLQDVLYGHYDALRLMFAQKYIQFNADDPFKVDYALVPHLMAAWRIPIRVTEETWKKFLPTPNALLVLTQERAKRSQKEVEKRSKRMRMSPPLEENIPITSRFPPTKENRPVVLFTGISGTTELSRKILELGGLVAKTYKECTHLVTDSVCRTVKFMCALNVCKYVLSKSWVIESAKENRFIDERLHVLHDPTNEDQFGCFVKEITSRTNRTPLFKGLTFYLTPGVKPSYSVVKEIIESAGGTVVPKCPPFKDIISANKNSPSFLVITCDNDGHLCKEMIKKNIIVYHVEFILTGVMRQELEYKSFTFTLPETKSAKPLTS